MDNFFLDDKGVWFQKPLNSKGELPEPIWVCSRLEVLAITRDHSNENHGKLLRFFDYDGVEHRMALPLERLAGDGVAYRQTFLSLGLRIKNGLQGRDLLSRYIQSETPTARIRCVNKLGWYNNIYVLPETTIGKSEDNEEVLFQSHALTSHHYSSKGTLEDWKKHVSNYCVDNSRLSFCLSLAFAAPLLHLLENENGGFHLRGPSSGGKTTALKVALSVYGGASLMHTWRATSNGLESVATLHNDGLLCLDELGKLDPKIAGEVAYMLVNGEGKQRSEKSGLARKKQCWRLFFLSTGEIGLPDLIRQSGQKVRGGHEVRVIDIPAFTDNYGVFEYLHAFASGDIFSRVLCENVSKYHGTAGKVFIGELVLGRVKYVERVEQLINDFVYKNTPSEADGQVSRVLHKFALVAAAGT
ncbi:MAG: DUF927 domain-containing protein, partial [Chlamydiia bacterium]|nr:DUF927 domain-containing protein [Chlamydiia bacterium]